MSGDIPKTAVKRGMNESGWNEYRQLSRDCEGDSDLKSILDLAFKDRTLYITLFVDVSNGGYAADV